MSEMQNLRNGMSQEYDSCNLCGEPIADKKYIKMLVYGRSEKRKVHCSCLHKYMEVDNTHVFNSTKVRKNGVINFTKLSITADNIDELKSYMISSGYTYVRANKSTVTFLSPRFSGFSSLSKMIFNANKRIAGFTIKNVDLYNASTLTSANVYMKNGKNTDYTVVGRYFNDGKSDKMLEYIKLHN